MPVSSFPQCTPDSTFTGIGFTPDPLPEGCVGVPMNQVITFGLPVDTTITIPIVGPVTLPFDSFVVDSLFFIPPGINWQCNQSNCHYISNPPNNTYGCVEVSGTPTDTVPGDSVEIQATAYITLAGNAVGYPQNIKVGWRVHPAGTPVSACIVRIENDIHDELNFGVYPNPASEFSSCSFALSKPGFVKLELLDIHGRMIQELANSDLGPGIHEIEIPTSRLPDGMFFLKLELNKGAGTTTKKLLIH